MVDKSAGVGDRSQQLREIASKAQPERRASDSTAQVEESIVELVEQSLALLIEARDAESWSDEQLRKHANDVAWSRFAWSTMRAGGTQFGSSGGTLSCLQDCETEYSRCIQGAGDWFQRYLCKLDATKCSAGCVFDVTGGIAIK